MLQSFKKFPETRTCILFYVQFFVIIKIVRIIDFFSQSLEEQLGKLTADFEQATSEKLKCQQEADATNSTIALANRLVGGLASENVRWADSVAK